MAKFNKPEESNPKKMKLSGGVKKSGKASGRSGSSKSSSRAKGSKKIKRKGHPANMFILYFLDMYRKHGGNMYCIAKVCGQRWKTLPQSEKDKYKLQYCANLKKSKAGARPGSSGESKKRGRGA